MLTRRKQEFINHYVLTKNATKSAELAGYSQKTAYSQGSFLLKNVEISSVINNRLKEISKGLSITKEKIMANLWNEANNAQRSADRIAANIALAKIRGDIKDSTNTQVSVFTGDMIKDLPPIDINSIDKGVDVTSSST